MLKFLLLIALVGVVFWMFKSKSRGRVGAAPPPKAPGAADDGPQAMLACAHCGVHLPTAEAVKDADGRPFCSEAHRLAGPR
jgi:uncharacterized protein